MMLKNNIFLVILIVCFSMTSLMGQEIDLKLDSIIRSAMRENMKLQNYHPYNDLENIERIRKDYKMKKDSTFISQLN